MQTIRRVAGTVTVVALLAGAVPASGHHAVNAQFDFNKPVELKGVLKKVEWINPHPYLHLEVTDAEGKAATWQLYMVAVGPLRKLGLGRQSTGGFVVGQTYGISGFAARDGSISAFVKDLFMPDGRKITIWFGDPNG